MIKKKHDEREHSKISIILVNIIITRLNWLKQNLYLEWIALHGSSKI